MTLKDPFDEIEKMQERMNKLMKSFWEKGPEFARHIRGFPVDITKENSNMVIRADLPGISKEDVDVKVSENQLKISAKQEGEKKEETGNYYRQERRSGKMERLITLPEDIESEKSEAKMEHGVLEIRIPLKEKEKKKEKEIKVK